VIVQIPIADEGGGSTLLTLHLPQQSFERVYRNRTFHSRLFGGKPPPPKADEPDNARARLRKERQISYRRSRSLPYTERKLEIIDAAQTPAAANDEREVFEGDASPPEEKTSGWPDGNGAEESSVSKQSLTR